MTIQRNAPCPCGSGKKYKHCHGAPGAQPAPQSPFEQGMALLRAGQPQAALPALLAAVQANPAHFEAHHALGAALLRTGRFADASAILYQATTLNPSEAAAHADLGAAYDNLNQHEPAIEAYRKAVELAPKLADIHLRLAQLYAMYSRTQDAAAAFERAADIKPNTTHARLYRADAFLLRNDVAAAEQWARKAIMLDPKNPATHGTLAGLLYNQGNFEAAAESFETALRLDPGFAKCWDGLAHCRKYTDAGTPVLARMRAALQRPGLHAGDRMTIHFALGKVLDDIGDYAGAMEQFTAANKLRAQGLNLDRAGLASLVDQTIERFTPEFIARQSALASQDETPLFIVGMYRSGTTLAEQILTAHPDVAAGGELTIWTPTDLEPDAATGAFDLNRTTSAIQKYLSALRAISPGAARVTDKLPTNFFRLGAIHALLPRARIVHCQRDPIDTCLSIYTTFFNTRMPFAARQSDLVFYYRQYQRLMAHWRQTLPPAVFTEIRYENLTANRAAETRRLVEFAGLPWNDACLAPELNTRPISTSSAWQARQPVYASSVQRWRRYEPWIGELLELDPARMEGVLF